MDITDVEVQRPEDPSSGAPRCWASVTFEQVLVIHNIRLDVDDEGVAITMPVEERGGEVGQIARTIDDALEHDIRCAIVEAYNRIVPAEEALCCD